MRTLLTLMLALWLSLSAKAQSHNDLNHITREKGLAGESVNNMIIDHRGVVWLATSNGVSCFDGVHPVTIPINSEGEDNLMVYDICEDDQQDIYITLPNHLYRLRKGEAAFSGVTPLASKTTMLPIGQKLYLVSSEGVQVYDGQKLRTMERPAGIEGEKIRSLARGDNDCLWLLTEYKLLRLKDGQPADTYDLRHTCPAGSTLSQVIVCGKQLFVGTKGAGLYRFDPSTGQATHIEGVGNVISRLTLSCDGRLSIATDGSGAWLLNAATGETERHLSSDQTDGGLPTNATYCYLHDTQGNDWVGLARSGLAYTYHQSLLAETYAFGDFTTKGLNVRSFCTHGEECLIGTYDGLYYVNETQGRVHYFSPQQLGGGHIITDIARYGGAYYIATFDGGLWKLNPGSLSLSKVGVGSELDNNSISVLNVSPDGKLWIGLSTSVFVLDSLDRITPYNENSLRISNVSVSDIVFDRQGNTWVCGSKGIAVFERRSGRFVDDAFPEGFFGHVGSLRGGLDSAGRMFFANKALYYTDSSLTSFGQLPVSTKLLAEGCDDLIADPSGYLWMATEKGLFCMSQDLSLRQHFGYGEGVNSPLIGRGSLRLTESGSLMFATADGLQRIDLTRLQREMDSPQPRVWLYDIVKGDHPLSATDGLQANENRRLKLSWSLGAQPLRAKPALQDYARPDGRFFEYRLDGCGDWTIVESYEDIVVVGLSLGSHQLTVRLMGVAATETTYVLSVYPSAGAVVLGVLLLLTVLLILLLRRERQSNRDLRSERDLVEEALIETEQELEEVNREAIETAKSEKYQRMRISEEECADIVARMRSWLDSSQAYTNPELKRSDMAEELKVPVAKLSQIFTMYLNENYYDFINRYRLEAFKRLLADGAYKRFTLTALSEQCGFKKSSFFRTFRKQEGMTPTEYLKQQNIKMKL